MNEGLNRNAWTQKNLKFPDILAISLTVLFGLVYSFFLIKLYQNYNFTVFDTGIAFHTEYIFLHEHVLLNWPATNILITPSTYGKLIYVIISPFMFLHDSPETWFVIQATWISVGSFIVYRIVEHETHSPLVGLTVQFIYFFFPGTYGVLPNGGNFVVFLETFMLLAYYLYLKEKYFLSSIVAIFGITTSPAAFIFFILMYGVADIRNNGYLYHFWNKLTGNQKIVTQKISKDYINGTLVFTLGVSVIVGITLLKTPFNSLLPSVFHFATSSTSSSALSSTGSGLVGHLFNNIVANSSLKIQFFKQLLEGFLYLPLFTLYSLPIIFYIAAAYSSNFLPFVVVQNHYTFYIAAFLFISFATMLGKFKKKKRVLRLIASLALISMLLSFAMYSPVSIQNLEDGTLHSELTQTQYQKYVSMAIDLIPNNASVFAQNDFPQLMNRQNFYMPGYYNGTRVDFAVIDPYTLGVMSSPFIGFNSSWAQFFYSNTSYGVYEVVGGLIVYKLGYDKNPVRFLPYSHTDYINEEISAGNYISNPVFSGVYSYYVPGMYELTYNISVGDNFTNSSTMIEEWTWVNTFHYHNSTRSTAVILPSNFVNLTSLKIEDGYIHYSVIQSFTSYEYTYQPNILLKSTNDEVSSPIDIVSLNVTMINSN